MTDTTQTSSTPISTTTIPFSARLQAAREAIGLDLKDAAAQLRLNERVILMLETDCYSSDLPPTFVRGYIRAYGKLLQIPEEEIQLAIAPIKPQQSVQALPPKTVETPKVTSSNYLMQLFTYLVVLTVFGLVGTWWYTHSAQSTTLASTELSVPTETPEASVASATPNNMTIKTDAVAGALTLGAKTNEPALPGTESPTPKPTIAALTPKTENPVTNAKSAESEDNVINNRNSSDDDEDHDSED